MEVGGSHVTMLLGLGLGGAEIPILVGAAVLLFGGSKIKEFARGLGGVKKEFMTGQAEAEADHERALAEARSLAERRATEPTRMYETQSANGLITGLPPTPSEPSLPRD